jgi:hypothetical protein
VAGELANSVYYSLSTIAQVLSGGLGALGALAVFRLARLDGAVDRYGDSLVGAWRDVSPDDEDRESFQAYETWRSGDPEAFLVFATTRQARFQDAGSRATFQHYRAAVLRRRALVSSFKQAFVISIVVIAAAGLGLIRGHTLSGRASTWLMGVTYAGLVLALASYLPVANAIVGKVPSEGGRDA